MNIFVTSFVSASSLGRVSQASVTGECLCHVFIMLRVSDVMRAHLYPVIGAMEDRNTLGANVDRCLVKVSFELLRRIFQHFEKILELAGILVIVCFLSQS